MFCSIPTIFPTILPHVTITAALFWFCLALSFICLFAGLYLHFSIPRHQPHPRFRSHALPWSTFRFPHAKYNKARHYWFRGVTVGRLGSGEKAKAWGRF